MADQRYDVYEVEIKNPENRRLMAANLPKAEADAFIEMAVYRRGVETHIYTKEERP